LERHSRNPGCRFRVVRLTLYSSTLVDEVAPTFPVAANGLAAIVNRNLRSYGIDLRDDIHPA
jgi:hypothetical protein